MPKETKKYTEKERAAAIRKMHHFLTNKDSNHYWVFKPGRKSLFMSTELAQDLFNLMQMFYYHEMEIAALAKWANTHKRAFKELTANDYKEVQNMMAVEAVQES